MLSYPRNYKVEIDESNLELMEQFYCELLEEDDYENPFDQSSLSAEGERIGKDDSSSWNASLEDDEEAAH